MRRRPFSTPVEIADTPPSITSPAGWSFTIAGADKYICREVIQRRGAAERRRERRCDEWRYSARERKRVAEAL